MNQFVTIYLNAFHEGIAKQAASIADFQPFAPENASITAGAAGALAGGALGGVGNALVGSSTKDPETGEKSNGVLARLLKGGLVGAAMGGTAGALAGPTLNEMGGDAISAKSGPGDAGLARSLSLSDMATLYGGQQLSPGRQASLGAEALIRGADQGIRDLTR